MNGERDSAARRSGLRIRFDELEEEIAARLGSVCGHLPSPDFRALVRHAALTEIKFSAHAETFRDLVEEIGAFDDFARMSRLPITD